MGTVEEDIAQFGGVDAPTTTVEEDVSKFGGMEPTPMAEVPKKVYDPPSGKTLEVPGWFGPAEIGQSIIKNFRPEHEDVGELGRAVMRTALMGGEAVGRTIQFIGDHINSASAPGATKPDFISNWEKAIREPIQKYGDYMVDGYKSLQQDFLFEGKQLTAANPDIYKGDFMENPSWTRAVSTVINGAPYLLVGAAATVASGGVPLAGAAAMGLLSGVMEYGQARDKKVSQGTADKVFVASSILNTLLADLPLNKIFGKGSYGKILGSLEGGATAGVSNVLMTLTNNAIAAIGYEPTRQLLQGWQESLIAGAVTGFGLGALSSPTAKRIDGAIEKLTKAGMPQADIEKLGYQVAVHMAENMPGIEKVIETRRQYFESLSQKPVDIKGLTPEEAAVGAVEGVLTPGMEGQTTPVDLSKPIDYQKVVEDAGGQFVGVTKGFAKKDGTVTPDLVQFRTPEGSTLALKSTDFTPENVQAKLEGREPEIVKPLPSEAAKAEPVKDIAPEVQKISENPMEPKTLEAGLPKIVTDLQTITAKINEAQSKGAIPEESLVKRQKELIDVLENLKSEEQAQPNPGIKKIIRQMTGQTELVPKEVTEMSALKASLQAQQRVAANAERMTKGELSDLKKGIVETIKTYVPKEAQGKMLMDIAKAEDGADLVKTMDKMERIAEDANRKTLLKELKREIRKVEASSVIAIDYVNKIRDLVDQFDLGEMKSETRSSLEKTQKYLMEQRAAGNDVSIPQYVLYQLQGLYRQSAANLDSNALRNLLSTVKLLKEVGRTKLRARQALQDAVTSQALIELTAGSKRMDTLPIDRPRVGDELSGSQKRDNKINTVLNWAQSKNLAITPIDVVMDMLDGNAGYTGPNMRIFKKTVDQAFSVYLAKKDMAGKKITELAKKLELDDPDFETIGFYAAKMQEGGVEKLENLGYTPEEISAVTLNENQTKLYETMRTELDNLRPEIAEVMRNTYNADLAEVKNYFPFVTDFEAMSDFEIKDRFMNGAPEMGQFKRVNVEKKFTLQRTGAGKQKIQLNAMQVYLQHLDNAAYLVTVGRHTKMLSDIARSDAYRQAVGDRGQAFMTDWLDTIARKGRKSGDKIRILDSVRKNIGMATLGFRLSSVLVQPSSLMDGAGLIGPAAFEGAGLIATSKEWRQFVMDNMPEVKNRIGDDPFYMEFGETSLLDKTGRASFWALQKLDSITASSVAAGAYLKFMRDSGLDVDLSKPNSEAINYAQLMMRRSQASAFFKDAPQALSRGALTGNASVDRLVLQFQTFMLNRWSMVAHDGFGLGFAKGNVSKGVNVMSYLMLAKIAELGSRGLSKELLNLITGEDKDAHDNYTEQAILSILGDIPFVGQIAAPFIYGGIPVPAIQMAGKTAERLNGFVKAKSNDAKFKNAVRAATLISGLLGVPGATQIENFEGKMMGGNSGGGRKKIAY